MRFEIRNIQSAQAVMENIINLVQKKLALKRELPAFKSGDNIVVNYKITEGDKVRIQAYRGDVIQIKGHGENKSFTVRKISNGVGVERIFPVSSPSIDSVEVLKRGKVRRARLYYLRDVVGKKARIKELKSSIGKDMKSANKKIAEKVVEVVAAPAVAAAE